MLEARAADYIKAD